MPRVISDVEAEREAALEEVVKQLKEDAWAAARRYLQLQGLLDAMRGVENAVRLHQSDCDSLYLETVLSALEAERQRTATKQQDSKNLFVGKRELVLGLCGSYASADKTIIIEPYLWSSQWYGCVHTQGVYLFCIKDTPAAVAECLNEKLKQLIEELS